MQEITFRGRLSEAQYLQMARFIWPTFLRATPYLVFLGCGVLVWRAWPLSLEQPFRILQILIVVVFAIVITRAPTLGARKAWKADPILQIEIHGGLSDEGLRWQQEDRGIRLPWSSVIGYRHSDEFLLLYRTPRQFLYVLRSFFANEDDWQNALALARKHAKPR